MAKKSTKMAESKNIKKTILPTYNYSDLTSNMLKTPRTPLHCNVKMQKSNFFIKLVTERYFKVNANWQIKNPTSFSSECSVIDRFSDLRGSSQRAEAQAAPRPSVLVCVSVCTVIQPSHLSPGHCGIFTAQPSRPVSTGVGLRADCVPAAL